VSSPTEENSRLLSARYPELYHVTGCGAAPGILRHGLLCTSSLLELFDAEEALRTQALSQRRVASISLQHAALGSAQIRDQIPLSLKRLEGALTDMTVQQWLVLLNSLCFFWPTTGRVKRLLGAPHYAELEHDVLVFDTAALIAAHGERVRLAAINTGATRPFARPRGRDTFLALGEFPLAERIGRVGVAGAVAEVAVVEHVPDARELHVRVERWRGATCERTIS
jgi:hypothetical protein